MELRIIETVGQIAPALIEHPGEQLRLLHRHRGLERKHLHHHWRRGLGTAWGTRRRGSGSTRKQKCQANLTLAVEKHHLVRKLARPGDVAGTRPSSSYPP